MGYGADCVNLISKQHGKKEVKVDLSKPIDVLYQQICKKSDFGPSIILIYKEKVLETRYTFEEYGIKRGDDIEVCPTLQHADEMIINLEDKSKIYPLTVSRNWTCDHLQNVVRKLYPYKFKTLYFGKDKLSEGKTLQGAGLYNGCSITIKE